MSDEQEQEFRPWKYWLDVPEEIKAQLLQGQFPKGVNLSASDLFYDALRKIVAAL